jgi:glycosyltransferase involved in cell wall biosynthesis
LGEDSSATLRVLFIAEAFGGGMFEITRMNAEGLARMGHEVGIAYGRRFETPADVRAAVSDDVELVPLSWADRSLRSQLAAQREIRNLVRRWRPDVVHLMSSFAGLHGAVAVRDVPTVYTPQAYAFTMTSEPRLKRWLYLLVENFVARRVTAVGACSLSEGEQARSLPGSRLVVVVPNGIDELNTPSGQESRRETSARVVTGMGRPLPQRQPEAASRILGAVRGAAEVKWIGGGQGAGPGVAALQGAGVRMTGWMSRKDTLDELAQSTVYLHWTAWDGLPLSVLEALALDVIVVASDIGPNREVLGPDQVCRTEGEAIRLIRKILDDSALGEEFLANQRAYRRRYSSRAMVARWSQVYRDLADGDLC